MNARATATEGQPAGARSPLYLALAALIAVLILVQALLAGEWLAGKDVIKVHQANGLLIVLLAIAQVVVVAATVRGSRRNVALALVSLFLLLVVVQLILGSAGFDNANQARALHILNGVLLFGLACGNVALALPQGSAAGAGTSSRA